MAVSLTCGCGARLEIDDKFAGQTVHCPDCQRPLEAPKVELKAVGPRTSGLALASLILALTGAFTLVGTVAAVVLGIIALVLIPRQADRLTGKGYAIAGIVLGAVLTAGTVFALSKIELLGLSGVIPDLQYAGRLDYPESLEVVRDRERFSIKRPSKNWGVYKPPAVTPGDFQSTAVGDLLLVLPEDDLVVLCFADAVHNLHNLSIYSCLDTALNKLADSYYEGLLFPKSGKGQKGKILHEGSVKALPKGTDNVLAAEKIVQKRVGNEEKTLLLRVYKKENETTMYVVVGATRKSNFARVEALMREAMDSFKILDRKRD